MLSYGYRWIVYRNRILPIKRTFGREYVYSVNLKKW
jgi:hypothetical protein